MLEELTRSAHDAAGRLQVRSALNPILWLTGIVLPLAIAGAWVFRENNSALCVFLSLCALPVVTACVAYVGFAIRKPDKLQSEDYQIRQQALHIIQRGSRNTPIDPASLRAIANPLLNLPDKGASPE